MYWKLTTKELETYTKYIKHKSLSSKEHCSNGGLSEMCKYIELIRILIYYLILNIIFNILFN